MKFLRVLAVALSVSVVAPVHAAFIGDYAYSNWDASLSYDGTVTSFGGADCAVAGTCTSTGGNGDGVDQNPGSGLVLNNPDASATSVSNWQQFSIVAAYDSLISFDWAYEALVGNGANLAFGSSFGYFIDGVFTSLFEDVAGDGLFLVSESGAENAIFVAAGQAFSFFFESNGLADATVTISNFDVEQASKNKTVPAPATFALLGIGLLGLMYARRRRSV